MHPAGPPAHTSTQWPTESRRRAWLYIAIALLLSLLAGLLTFLYLDGLQQRSLPTAAALVARRPIAPGELIDPPAVETRLLPRIVLPDSALTSSAEAAGRIARFGLAANEIVLQSDVAIDGGAGLSARLPDDRWAMVLPAGWLASPLAEHAEGDRLDLLAYQNGHAAAETGLIVESVEILSVPAGNGGEVTLAVSLEQAVSILYARTNGFQVVALLRPRGQ
jgi:Flp pilus assembly protein CpaB